MSLSLFCPLPALPLSSFSGGRLPPPVRGRRRALFAAGPARGFCRRRGGPAPGALRGGSVVAAGSPLLSHMMSRDIGDTCVKTA